MHTLPTAEELLDMLNITVKHESKIALLRSYARGYVIEALEAAYNNAESDTIPYTYCHNCGNSDTIINKESILSSYPLEKIV